MQSNDDESGIKENPRKNANFFKIITFWYTLNTFKIGYSRDLTESDLTKPLDTHKSAILGDKISRIWTRECDKALKSNRKPSLTYVIYKTFIKDIILYGIILFLLEIGVRLQQPIFIGLFLRYFNPIYRSNGTETDGPTYFMRVIAFYTSAPVNSISLSEAYFFGAGIMLCSMIIVIVFHPYMMEAFHVGMKIRVATSTLVYRKILRMPISAIGENEAGNPVNLLANDVNRFDFAPIFLHYLWLSPLQMIIIAYLLYTEYGWPGFFGIIVILIIMPLQTVLGYLTAKFRWRIAVRTDKRVSEMNELIKAMQVIKMYTWEYAFADLIHNLRKKEIDVIRFTNYIRGIIMSLIMFTTRSAIAVTVITYVWAGHEVTAEKVFVLTGFYQILRQTMTVYFPQGVGYFGEAYVTVKRLEEFMLLEEAHVGDRRILRRSTKPTRPDFSVNIDTNIEHQPLHEGESPNITIDRAVAVYKKHVVLSNVDLEVEPEKLTIIVGPVGAGKSCLLHLILGELTIIKGSVCTKGVISYASQEAWLFVGSVRLNILFGRPFNKERYQKVVEVCALLPDFALLPYGDRTIIGERGVSLSGGQRARVNLARAVYKEADIYMLDDPLSAVDVHVAQQLFMNCVCGFLGGKVVVLVTHQLQFVKNAKQIVVLHDGVIEACGTYESLNGSEFLGITLEEDVIEERTSEKPKVETILKRLSLSAGRSITTTDREGSVSFKEPLPVAEIRSYGAVDSIIYKRYFTAAGHFCLAILLIILFLLAQLLASSGDYFLSVFVNLEEFDYGEKKYLGIWENLKREDCIIIYSILVILTVVVAVLRSLYFFSMCLRSSIRLHDDMYKCITHATMKFFNENTSGRILNRFSKDLGCVDELLPFATIDTVQISLNLFGAVIVIAFIEPFLLIATTIMIIVFYFIRRCFLRTSRDVKRLDGITKSPVFAHLNATIDGLPTIRCNEAEEILVKEFDNLQDVHSSSWFMFLYTSRAFGMCIDFICAIFIGLVTFIFLIDPNAYTGSQIGLVITQCMGLSGLIQWGMRQSAEMDNQMTAVERVLEFTTVEQEEDLHSAPENKPPPDWPQNGVIEYVYTTMRYNPKGPAVLKSLNLLIKSEEKVGIVGRTGAGKSSLISTLFRLNPFDGLIIIDDIDIKTIGLHDLRRKISIIPQEPVLFSGTLRYNLDPFSEYSDESILSALIDVELKFALNAGIDCLDQLVAEGGSNFSVGQRQLVCLARAILRNNKILVMDEATANVDPQTDSLIQRTIRTKFAHCTVLTIAHRLHTIMDSDKVLVMEAGIVVEFDHPWTLLQNKTGLFSTMVEKTGPQMSEKLKKISKDNYDISRTSE